MLYKYMLLAKDISHFCDKQGWATFMTSDIKEFINTRRGFYSYSDTTLNNAIDFLIHTDKVLVHRANKHVARVFVYVPVVRKQVKERIEHDETRY